MRDNWYKLAQASEQLSLPLPPSSKKPYREFESIADVYYRVDDEQESILREFYDKKRKPKTMMSWPVIPFARLKKIWNDYARMGVVRDERGMDDIANQMLKTLSRLQAATDWSGHSSGDMDERAKELGFKPIGDRNDDFYWHFLETPHGTPISDFGLPRLWKIAEGLPGARTPEEKLLIVDQMLNVIHQRGDMAALFVEGGRKSLSQLSARPGS